LTQIRTGRLPLNDHLCKIKKADTDKCEKCNRGRRETVQHFLFECQEYKILRSKMDQAHKKAKRNLKMIFQSEQHTKILLRYVVNTRRF
ncbi:hypothetical protein FA13DRAFT_1582165, partial [Coprinellus micaceus]